MASKNKHMKRAAHKAPAWVREIAMTKVTKKQARKHKTKKLGRFGAASEVRVLVKDGVPQTAE